MKRDQHAFPTCYWFTGLSGAGKTTLARAFAADLQQSGAQVVILDGDELRAGLNKDLGFGRDARKENARRIAEVARLILDSGLHVLVASIAPYAADRQLARTIIGTSRYNEVLVDTKLEICVERDPKGLYAEAKAGRLKNLTGWGEQYEVPERPQVRISTENASVLESLSQLKSYHSSKVMTHESHE
jgi:adenylylsulfate kinase